MRIWRRHKPDPFADVEAEASASHEQSKKVAEDVKRLAEELEASFLKGLKNARAD